MAKDKTEKAKKKRIKRKKRLIFFLWLQLILVMAVLGAVLYYYAGGYAKKVSALHDEAVSFVQHSTPETFRQDETSIAYDVNNEVISVMKGEKDVYYVEYKYMPAYLTQAIVSIEDKRFFSHHGVDYKAIVRAVVAMFRNGEVTQGASTITQQLARNMFLSNDKTWERKIEEIYIAVELEKKYSKNEILEFYLNNVYFANGYYGIGAASRGYFNSDVSGLSLSELAFLCAIPNGPSKYDPVTHYDYTIERRNRILKNMLEDKVISEITYMSAVGEEITLRRPPSPDKNDYLTTYTYYCATRVLMEQHGFTFQTVFKDDGEKAAYDETYAEMYAAMNKTLYTGGYRIYTSLDRNVQEILQYSIDHELSDNTEVNEDGIYALQGSAVCIDNTTGMVRAIVGGRTQDIQGYTLNRAFQSFRQPGSSIKPLIVYTPLLERGYTPDSVVLDFPSDDGQGPKNADDTYLGFINLRRAVELSRNAVAYNLFKELTPEVGLSYLEEMQFGKLDKNDYRPIVAIGGMTHGVSALEMAKAYATLENDGAYRDPGCILKITDPDGNVIYQAEQTEKVIYQTDAARVMTDILQGVVSEGTARGIGLTNMPCAGKTGTTNDNKDGWFVGYTRYYTTSVWVGFDMPKTLPTLTGSSLPGSIWKNFMTRLHADLPPQDFPEAKMYLPEEPQNATLEINNEQDTIAILSAIANETEGRPDANENLPETEGEENPPEVAPED